MSLVSVISFLICILIIVISFRPKIDVLSPAKVGAFVWALVIGITDLKLSGFQKQWSFEIWIQVLIGPIAFLIGTFIIYILNVEKKIWSINDIRKNREIFCIDTKRLYNAVLVLFFLFLVSYIVIYLKSGEIPMFSPKPGKARENFTMFGLGLFLHNVVLIGFFTTLYGIFEKKEKLKKTNLILMTFISIVMYAITLQRYQIIMTVMMIFTVLYYFTFRVKLKTIVLFAVVVIIFFFVISSFRVGELISIVLYKISKMRYSPTYAVFTEPYMYVAMNLENYAHAISKTSLYSFGYYTFDFVTAVSGLKHWISEYFYLNDTPFLLTRNYNTFSALWTYYRDFGIIGVFTIPFLGGILLSSLYYSLKVNPTLKKYSLYGMFLSVVIFSFFISALGYLWFIYNAIVLLVIINYISKENPKIDS